MGEGRCGPVTQVRSPAKFDFQRADADIFFVDIDVDGDGDGDTLTLTLLSSWLIAIERRSGCKQADQGQTTNISFLSWKSGACGSLHGDINSHG